MRLQLTRPIAFIDIESTGTNRETDRILELSICKLFPDASREVRTRRINPGMPIPPEATLIHGITDADVIDQPPFSSIAKGVLEFVEGCDIGGFNSNAFDVPLLYNEFIRAGIDWDYTAFKMVDAGNIFKIQEPRSLSAAVKFYTGKEHAEAHSAEADILATVEVFLKQMEKYEELPTSIDELHLFCNYGKPVLDISGKFTYNEAGDIIFNFGTKKGLIARDNLDYVDWMYNKASFSPDTRAVCCRLLYPQQSMFS